MPRCLWLSIISCPSHSPFPWHERSPHSVFSAAGFEAPLGLSSPQLAPSWSINISLLQNADVLSFGLSKCWTHGLWTSNNQSSEKELTKGIWSWWWWWWMGIKKNLGSKCLTDVSYVSLRLRSRSDELWCPFHILQKFKVYLSISETVFGLVPAIPVKFCPFLHCYKNLLTQRICYELNFLRHLEVIRRDPTEHTAWPNSAGKQIRNFVSKCPLLGPPQGVSQFAFTLEWPRSSPCSLIPPLSFLLPTSSQESPPNSSHCSWVQGLTFGQWSPRFWWLLSLLLLLLYYYYNHYCYYSPS